MTKQRWSATLGLALTFWLTGCATAPPPSPPATNLTLPAASPAPALAPASWVEASATLPNEAELPLDPVIRKGKLDNGLTYLVRANARPEQRAELWLVVNAGSVLEDEDQRGLAHFIEHMLFNGTRRFPRHKLVEYFETIGMRFGADLNAFTGFDETAYTLRIPTDKPEILETAFEIFGDWIGGGVTFDPAEIDKERGVVLEEWRLGRDAQGRLGDRQNQVLLAGSRYAERFPIGLPDVIRSASRETIVRFYQKWYRPELAAVIAVGDFDPDHVAARIRHHFSPIPKSAEPTVRPAIAVPDHPETRFSIVEDPELTQTNVAVLYKHPRASESRVVDYRRFLLENLYDLLVNARLGELAQQPNPPFLFAGAASDDLVRTAAAYIQIAGAKDGDVVGALEALLAEAERIERFAFTEGELERAKVAIKRNYQQAVAENGKTDSNTIAAEYMRHFLEGEPVPGIALELALVERFLDGITLEELNQLGRDWITEHNRVVLVSGPGKQDRPLPSETELAAVFETAGAREVERYVDRVLDEPILPTKPSPGRIVDERRVADLGITEWRLSNGARVIAKPTDFQNDEILLQAFSPGGTSIVADEDYNSALFATALLGEGGLGRFPKLELEKALSGKIANINVDIDELEEGLQAVASKLDLETMFQLVYLAFTAPRADEEAAQGFLLKLSDLIADRLDSPENYFQDKVSEALFQGHPRRRPLTREVLTTIELERSLAVYRERFADVSDFTFVLVGSFTLEELKPFVEGYLAALPALDRRETWRDIGVEAPNRLVDVRVQKGTEPKAAVSLVFTGAAPFSFAAAHELGTLSDVLSMRLRDVLREDRGQTYGVAVDANLRARPRGTYNLSIAFGCAPENSASLIDAVFAEIKRLRDDGPTREELAKIFETQRRERQSALRQNAFWLNVLSNSYRLGRSPQELLRLDAQIAATTPRSLRQAARLYLPLDRYILGVLGPESPAPAHAATGAAQN